MSKLIVFLCFLMVIASFSSCTLEKRIYRPGFFAMENVKTTFKKKNLETENPIDNEIGICQKLIAPGSIPAKTPTIEQLQKFKCSIISKSEFKIKSQNPGTPFLNCPKENPRKRSERLNNSAAQSACESGTAAKTILILSKISIYTCWFFGFGIVLAAITLLISYFVKKRIIAKGICVTENLALIEKGKQNCINLIVISVGAILLIWGAIALMTWLLRG